jgi:hypothetical protein
VPEAVTCDLRLGLGVGDLVGDEQSYLLHCLNTAGHMIQFDMSLPSETNTSMVRSSRTFADCSNADQSGVAWAGLVDYQGTVCRYSTVR